MEAPAVDAADATPQVACPHLPPHVLERILQFLPLSTRHTCALVDSLWAAAATAATAAGGAIVLDKTCQDSDSEIDAAVLSTAWATSLQQWLDTHGHSITKLHLADDSPDGFNMWSLPCKQLRNLSLRNVQLDLYGEFAGCLQDATGLTSLSLDYQLPTHSSSEEDAAAQAHLSVLTSLQRLQRFRVQGLWYCVSAPEGIASASETITTLAERLPMLTRLAIGGNFRDWDAPAPGVWTLKRLRHLELRYGPKMCYMMPEAFAGLSKTTQLTALSIQAVALHIYNWSPGLSCLTQLRCLRLEQDTEICDQMAQTLEPALLAPLTNLQHLDLEFNRLTPKETGATDLLQLLPRLQQLTALGLRLDKALLPHPLTPILCLSRLKQLQLPGPSVDDALVAGIAQHLTCLRDLDLGGASCDTAALAGMSRLRLH